MANNFSVDPKNVLPINNTPAPQNGLNNVMPSTHSSLYDGHRRLPTGIELSGARYRIEKLIAAGGMGAVYKALDNRFNRYCAVKEMLDDFRSDSERTQAVEWFSREATLLLDLNHPYVPRVRDFFVEGGRHYLVMDLIDGRTLGEVVEKEGNVIGLSGARGITEERARRWAEQICNVLAYLHKQMPPIIFRDLKPSNIMVTQQDEIRLIDFGIARSLQSQTGQPMTVISTMGYAPPEQMLGEPEPRSDLFALGATMHKVVTRHDASNNKPNIFMFPPIRALRPDVSISFEQIIMKALAYKVEMRWSSAQEMERAIVSLPAITVIPPTVAVTPAMERPANPSTPNSAALGSGLSGGAASPATPFVAPVSAPQTGMTGPAAMHITNALSSLANGRIDIAYAAVQQAYALEPNNAVVHKIFGQVFARRQPAQVDLAQRAYERSLQLNANDAETHKLFGDIFLFLRQQPSLAIPAYIQSIRLNSKDAETHHRLGQCYERTGQLDSALRAYQEAVNLAPKQIPFELSLGHLAMRLNQLATAEHAFVEVLFSNPADHQIRFLLSQVYERENKLEDAFRECSFVVGPLGATNPAVTQMYHRLRTRLGR